MKKSSISAYYLLLCSWGKGEVIFPTSVYTQLTSVLKVWESDFHPDIFQVPNSQLGFEAENQVECRGPGWGRGSAQCGCERQRELDPVRIAGTYQLYALRQVPPPLWAFISISVKGGQLYVPQCFVRGWRESIWQAFVTYKSLFKRLHFLWFPWSSAQGRSWEHWSTPFIINLPCFVSWVDSNILGKKGRCLILSCSHLSMWFELMEKMGSCQGSRMWAPRQI